jgi:hypothetical protein
MKYVHSILMVVAILLALFIPKEMEYAMVFKYVAIAYFMYGLMKLMSKIPSKNHDDDTNSIL